MALRKLVERITKPTSELDREELAAFCDELGLTPMDEIVPRSPCRVGGEVKAVRIVPGPEPTPSRRPSPTVGARWWPCSSGAGRSPA
ncbi:MAG: hypothetical protein M5U14_18505 [Acidimicrobiia bacterium]|nr:hypothetical protein [Acidimicrobiia bacterium]